MLRLLTFCSSLITLIASVYNYTNIYWMQSMDCCHSIIQYQKNTCAVTANHHSHALFSFSRSVKGQVYFYSKVCSDVCFVSCEMLPGQQKVGNYILYGSCHWGTEVMPSLTSWLVVSHTTCHKAHLKVYSRSQIFIFHYLTTGIFGKALHLNRQIRARLSRKFNTGTVMSRLISKHSVIDMSSSLTLGSDDNCGFCI